MLPILPIWQYHAAILWQPRKRNIFYNTITCLITKTTICHVHQNKWFAQFFCRTEPFVLTTVHEIALVHIQLQLIKTNN
jgi:hypothetical protein